MTTTVKGRANGARPVTLAELKRLKVERPPNASERWQPLPHHELLAIVGKALNATPTAHLDRRGNLVAFFPHDGYQLSIISSASQRKALTFYAGTPEYVHAGSKISGGGQHYRDAEHVKDGVAWFLSMCSDVGAAVAWAKATPIPAKVRDRLPALVGQVVPWSRVGQVLADPPATVWHLQVAVAAAVQKSPPLAQPELLDRWREVIGGTVCGRHGARRPPISR